MYEYMRMALEKAREAASRGEIPVGAVIVRGGEIICFASNECEQRHDPTAHAEILAIRQACGRLESADLSGCELYVTLEPCPMCAGAIVSGGLSKLVFGSYDSQYGACGSVWNITAHPYASDMEVYGGIMESECTRVLKDFFSEIRQKKKTDAPPISIS